jgi:RNA polymerase sigma-70 factor (ECF subfamily)
MGYVSEQKSQMHSELGLLMPRLKSFAMSLTGDEAQALALVKVTRQHLLTRTSKERGHTPLILWAFMQLQRIWATRGKSKATDKADPRLFQPRSRVGDGGVSARLAMRLAQFSPSQRGTLHLVYGERLSYDEAAEIFDVPVSEIIARLSKCYAALAVPLNRSAPYSSTGRSQAPAPRAASMYGRGRAA